MRRLRWILLGAVVAGLIAALAGAWMTLRSQWFAGKVRSRIVHEIERATGGRAEIAGFTFDWKHMTARVRGFVLHGSEAASAPPLFRAESVEVDLKVISVLRKDVDLESLSVAKPELRIQVDADGTTNLPRLPAAGAGPGAVEAFLRLAVMRVELLDGFFEYASQRVPLNLRGENLAVRLDFEGAVPRYHGAVSVRKLELASGSRMPATSFDLELELAVERDTTRILSAKLEGAGASVRASGEIRNAASLETNLQFSATAALAQVGRTFRVNLGEGTVNLEGQAGLARDAELRLKASLAGAGLMYQGAAFEFRGITLKSAVEMRGDAITVSNLLASSPDGEFQGRLRLEGWSRFQLDGKLAEISVASLKSPSGQPLPWSGLISGPVRARGEFTRQGVRNSQVETELSVVPVATAIPIEGFLGLTFDQRKGTIALRDTNFRTPDSRLEFAGTLGQKIRFAVSSRNPADVLTAVAIVRGEPVSLPEISFKEGSAKFEGVATGELGDPHVRGRFAAEKLAWNGQLADKLNATVEASKSSVTVSGLRVEHAGAVILGRLSAGLTGWRPADSAPLNASLQIRSASLDRLLKAEGLDFALRGALTGAIEVSGTQGSPQVSGTLRVEQPQWGEERFDSLAAQLRYQERKLEMLSARMESGPAAAVVKGSWRWTGNGWKEGEAEFETALSAWTLARIQAVRANRPGLDARIKLNASGAARFESGVLSLTRLDGKLGLEDVTARSTRIGSVLITTRTEGNSLLLRLNADLGGTSVEGNGQWQLGSREAGSARINFAPLSFATLQQIWPAAEKAKPWPFSGVVAGNLVFRGTGLAPEKWDGRVNVTRLEINPNWEQAATAPVRLALRNEGPVTMEFDHRNLRIRTARLIGQETNVEAEGTFTFASESPWDLRLKGAVNLELAREFAREVNATGIARLDANVRGALADPQLFGRLELVDASLSLGDLPNGLEKAKGTLLFDRKRITIDGALTALTGGGELSLSGFLEFSGEELRYRLLAKASRIRVRYPEGVSTLADADLSYTGSSTRSLLGGAVTVLRSTFTPRMDIGDLLAQAVRAAPPALPASSEVLRGMQFDVRILTGSGMEFQSSLTRDLEASADLRLRGSPLRPLLLGRVQIDQGEINFFGTKYTIGRGEIAFFNPVRIEPVLDMDVETRVRGVVVTINFAGPIDKLNVSYRSDPPLRSNEIVALLAVGRSPDSVANTLASPSQQRGALSSGANSLLGQALSAPISSRMQRFFGVSRVKIDPQLTGLEGTPQARLTVEQDVSRDVTVTFVTNLNRSPLQQIVRVEWNINRTWSALATRDENGLFSVEFQYKKSFR